MSLGLFNCRLIQPPEISYSSYRLSCRTVASSAELCSGILVTRHARPDQREGAECFLSFLLREVLFWFLPSDADGLFPPIHPRIPPKVSNPTHRFCYGAGKSYWTQNCQPMAALYSDGNHRHIPCLVDAAPLCLL